jgi:hypothetical protein
MDAEEAVATMDVAAWLIDTRSQVLDEAYTALGHTHPTHYEAAGESVTRERLGELFSLVVSTLQTRDLAALSTFVQQLATRRFDEGFPIAEVQAAMNSLEEAMWHRVVDAAPADELADAIGMLSTVLGYAKDTLARTWVSLATKRHVPTLDLSALFAGGERP